MGFAVVEADAGEEVIVDVPLSPRAFQHWDGGWQTEPGEFTLEAACRSRVAGAVNDCVRDLRD